MEGGADECTGRPIHRHNMNALNYFYAGVSFLFLPFPMFLMSSPYILQIKKEY